MSARKGSQLFEHPSRKTMWFPLCRLERALERHDANWKNHPRSGGRTGEDFSWSFWSRRLAFMCILCIYYGCLPGIARQNHRSLENSSFCSSAGLSLETVPHNVRGSWARVGGSLIDTVILAPPVLVVRLPLTIRANLIDFDRCRRWSRSLI